MPVIKQNKSIEIASQMIPRRLPVICCTAIASDERRLQIAPELFSGRSKKAISWRRRCPNALARIRSINLEPDTENAVYYKNRKYETFSL